MNPRELQSQIVDFETFWLGGVQDAPAVYGTGARHHVVPNVRGSQGQVGVHQDDRSPSHGPRIAVDLVTGTWTLEAAVDE
ncbi:MAG TPA: hypothetical protein VGC04_10615 [Cellulomonas sp.]